MATGYISLLPGGAVLPDGSSGNAAPALVRVQGIEANPKKHYLALSFDAATDEFAYWQFRMPGDYASGGSAVVHCNSGSTTAGHEIAWGALVSATTPGDADKIDEHASAVSTVILVGVNTTEAWRLLTGTITLSMDSAAAGDFISLGIYRDADHASDDATGDAALMMVEFSYTTT